MQIFTIAPASGRGLWLIAAVALVALIPIVVVLTSALAATRGARFEVTADGLRLRGDFYGRFIPAHDIRAGDARRVDFAASPELRPRWRTLGTGLPGYSAGWFRLQNGEKALLYLTDRTRAVYVPTSAGYSVLLSPEDPDGFVAALHGLAPP